MASTNPNFKMLSDPMFWKNSWEGFLAFSLENDKNHVKKKGIEFWNKRAFKYRQDGKSINQDRQSKVIRMLEQEGVLLENSDLLDVGCGDGTYALSFAQRSKSVIALDGAGEMCKLLEERATAAGLQNITIFQRMWEDVNLMEEGLAHRFDLVFASMTPAVCDYDTFMKLIQASKKYCCLISWAKGSRGHVPRELWKLIFNEDDEEIGKNIVFQANLLFSMGYLPVVRYFDTYWVQREPVDEVIRSFSDSLGNYTKMTPRIREIIYSYVAERAEGRVFTKKNSVRLSMLIWRVDESWDRRKNADEALL